MCIHTRIFSFFRSIGPKLGASLLLSFPIAVYVSGGAKLSEQPIDTGSCITRSEFNFLGIFAFRIDSYNEECSEAQAVLAIMNAAAYTEPPDPGMVAVAVRTWMNKYPRIEELVETINKELLRDPNSSVSIPLGTEIESQPGQ